MKNKHKHPDKQLQKYTANQSFVKIYRTIFGNIENLYGFVVSISKSFMLIHVAPEFRLDGFAIIKKNDFDYIRNSSFEKTQKKIFKAEGFLDKDLSFDENFKLNRWVKILKQLKKMDFHVIIESEKNGYLEFYIGQIVAITKKNVSILNYDANGIYDDKPTKIKYKRIRVLKFGDHYSTVFRKYLK